MLKTMKDMLHSNCLVLRRQLGSTNGGNFLMLRQPSPLLITPRTAIKIQYCLY